VAAPGQRRGRKMEVRRTLIVVLAGTLLCGCTASSLTVQAEEPGVVTSSPERSWEQGKEAYERKDYAGVAKWYRKAAEQGDTRAQYNLGLMYNNGQGVPRDDAEAVRWYRKAAEQGNARAQFNSGWFVGGGSSLFASEGCCRGTSRAVLKGGSVCMMSWRPVGLVGFGGFCTGWGRDHREGIFGSW